MSYVQDRADAARAFGEDGMTFTLTYPATSTYDPATGTTTGTTPDDEIVAGAIFPLNAFKKAGNSNIVEGDSQALLAAQNTDGEPIAAPQVNGTLVSGATTWTIIAAEPLSPAGIDVLHDLVVRRAA